MRRALVTEGAFANQNEFTHLTTIEQIDPIYVRFSQPASQYSSLRRAVVSGLWKGVPLGEIKVRLAALQWGGIPPFRQDHFFRHGGGPEYGYY